MTTIRRSVLACALACALACVLASPPSHAQSPPPHYTALLSGQSNACALISYVTGSALWICAGGQPIASWDPGTELGSYFRAWTGPGGQYSFDVLVWWQGENDVVLGTDQLTYANKLYDLMAYANVPVMIVQIGTVPGDPGAITAVHQYFATDPAFAFRQYVAFIPTADLEHDGAHFTAAGYQAVRDRLAACYAVQCWGTQ